MDLNHARLPIPPLRRGKRTSRKPDSLPGQLLHSTSSMGDSQRAARPRLTGGGVALGLAVQSLLPVLLQLVMKCLEADRENLGSSRLVVMGCLQRFKDQQ